MSGTIVPLISGLRFEEDKIFHLLENVDRKMKSPNGPKQCRQILTPTHSHQVNMLYHQSHRHYSLTLPPGTLAEKA